MVSPLPPLPQDVPHVERDSVGRIIPPQCEDQWEGRVGVAKAMGQLGPLLAEEEALELLHSIIPWGLEDPRGEVREAMQEAAASTIARHGKVRNQFTSV